GAKRSKLEHCAFGLRPGIWPPVRKMDDRFAGPYAIEIRVSSQSFAQAARAAFFEQVGVLRDEWAAPGLEPSLEPGDWLVLGRQASRNPAQWIQGDGWFGLYGKATIGYFGP